MFGYIEGALDSPDRLDFTGVRPQYESSIANEVDSLQYSFVTVSVEGAALDALKALDPARVTLALEDLPGEVRREAHVEAALALVQPRAALNLEVTSKRDWTAMARDGMDRSGSEARRSVLVHPRLMRTVSTSSSSLNWHAWPATGPR